MQYFVKIANETLGSHNGDTTRLLPALNILDTKEVQTKYQITEQKKFRFSKSNQSNRSKLDRYLQETIRNFASTNFDYKSCPKNRTP